MVSMPIYDRNHSKDLFSRTTGQMISLIFCRKHIGHHPVYTYNHSVWIVNRPLVGGENLGKDVKFQTHGPVEPGSLLFRGLLKILTTFMKFRVRKALT